MPLFEVETDAHIIITWADDEGAATTVAADCYPRREHRPSYKTSSKQLGHLQRCARHYR